VSPTHECDVAGLPTDAEKPRNVMERFVLQVGAGLTPDRRCLSTHPIPPPTRLPASARRRGLQVVIKQNALIGIPGAVYDCSLALAGYVIDELLPPATAGPPGSYCNAHYVM